MGGGGGLLTSPPHVMRLAFGVPVLSLAGTYASPTFGQTTVAYQDTSTTSDPGGRLLQFVLRFNF
jgi:hypothetical protein